MSNSIRVAGVCLLLSGLLVAGCGGDDDSAQGEGASAGAEAGSGQSESAGGNGGELEPTSESKEEYVAKANGLCQKRTRQMQADVAEALKNLSADGGQEAGLLELIEGGVAPGMEAEAEELRRLGAPEGDEEQVEAIVATIEATLAEARKNPKAFVEGGNPFGKAERLAREYGIGACGKTG